MKTTFTDSNMVHPVCVYCNILYKLYLGRISKKDKKKYCKAMVDAAQQLEQGTLIDLLNNEGDAIISLDRSTDPDKLAAFLMGREDLPSNADVTEVSKFCVRLRQEVAVGGLASACANCNLFFKIYLQTTSSRDKLLQALVDVAHRQPAGTFVDLLTKDQTVFFALTQSTSIDELRDVLDHQDNLPTATEVDIYDPSQSYVCFRQEKEKRQAPKPPPAASNNTHFVYFPSIREQIGEDALKPQNTAEEADPSLISKRLAKEIKKHLASTRDRLCRLVEKECDARRAQIQPINE